MQSLHSTVHSTMQSIMQSTVHSPQSTMHSIMQSTMYSPQSTAVLIHSVRHWPQQKMFAVWRGGCQLIPIPILLALAIARFRMSEEGVASILMAIYISVTYIQSPPKFPISAWPYWPPGAVTQQRSDLYNSQIFTAVLFQLVKNVKSVIFLSHKVLLHLPFLTHHQSWTHHDDSKMCFDIVEVNGFRCLCQPPIESMHMCML